MSKLIIGSASDDSIVTYPNKKRAETFRNIEACHSSLEVAKTFVLTTDSELIKTNDNEVDSYIENFIKINDHKTMNFNDFSRKVLEFIHYGASVTRVDFEKDSSGEPYPVRCVRIDPARLYYEKGQYKDRKTGKPFDLSRYYIVVESLSENGIEQQLLNAIEAPCKVILEAYKTLPPAIRKYKNNPKIGVIKGTNDPAQDKANCETVSALLSELNEKTTITITDLEKILQSPVADIEKVQTVQDKQEMKILRAYVGHSELLAGSGTGNNTKMIKIMELAENLKEPRVALLENAQNQLIATIVKSRFDKERALPTHRYKLKNEGGLKSV